MPAVIKKISKESWRAFREESIRHGVTAGRMLEILVKEHVENEKNKANAWDSILTKKKPLLTKKEAENVRKKAEEFRTSFRMRI